MSVRQGVAPKAFGTIISLRYWEIAAGIREHKPAQKAQADPEFRALDKKADDVVESYRIEFLMMLE